LSTTVDLMVAIWKGNLNIATTNGMNNLPISSSDRLGSLAEIAELDQSGQKWRVAPLSTMAPSLSLGTEESLDAISAKSDVQVKAKASGFSV